MIAKPEIEQLIRNVERHYGRMLHTTTDFEVFSLHLKRTKQLNVSSSTLKRIWGYVDSNHQTRVYTLDLLANYIGFQSYADFLIWLKNQMSDNSEYMDLEQILSSDLSVGDMVRIGWSPDRLLQLIYRGDNRYEVIEACNSKIVKGDQFDVGCFVKGQPLILPFIIHDGQPSKPFIAGRDGGLTVIIRQ